MGFEGNSIPKHLKLVFIIIHLSPGMLKCIRNVTERHQSSSNSVLRPSVVPYYDKIFKNFYQFVVFLSALCGTADKEKNAARTRQN
jgi:hypothetical protein